MVTWAQVDWTEVRSWAQLAIIATGGVVALFTYLANQRQRRFENALRLVAEFKEALREEIAVWQRVQAENQPRPVSFSTEAPPAPEPAPLPYRMHDLWMGQGVEGNAVERILDALTMSSYELERGYADLRVFYTELGWLIETIYAALAEQYWVQACVSTRRILDMFYPQFTKFYEKNQHKFGKWYYRDMSLRPFSTSD